VSAAGEGTPASAERSSLRCAFAYAAPGVELCLELELPPGATAAVARDAARLQVESRGLAPDGGIPWDAAECGLCGQISSWETPLEDGDRVELYRPLEADPRVSRRSRVEAARRRAGGAPALGVSGRGGRGLG